MKTRSDFVSNSSSSSFVVIADNGTLSTIDVLRNANRYSAYDVPNKTFGCRKFGWQNEMYSSFADKLNWCGIILLNLFEACVNTEIAAGFLGKKASKIDKDYTINKEKYVKWKTLLENVCKSKFGLPIRIDTSLLSIYGGDEDGSYASICSFGCYIDHQSNIFEAPENGDMFKSEESLYNFLAYDESYIQCGNDNEDDNDYNY